MLKQIHVSNNNRSGVAASAAAEWGGGEADYRPAGGQCLIPDSNPLSDLFDDIRLEKSSYELLRSPFVDDSAFHSLSDLVGLFIIGGTIEIVWENGAVERLERADFILLTPRQEFTLRVVNAEEHCTIGRVTYQFDVSRARLLFKLLPRALVTHSVASQEVSWQMALAHLIAEQPVSFGPANAAISRRLVEAGLVGVIQMFLARNAPLGHLIDPRLARIAPSLRAIHRVPEKTWTIASLASLSAMSRTLFVATFVEGTGETPGHYLAVLRLERARDLLRQSSLPLAAIAHRAGYGSDVAFIRAFKRQFGISPGRFRSDSHKIKELVAGGMRRMVNALPF
jgi:AraC-like DNA-binding protein